MRRKSGKYTCTGLGLVPHGGFLGDRHHAGFCVGQIGNWTLEMMGT